MTGFCGWCGQDWDGVAQHKCEAPNYAMWLEAQRPFATIPEGFAEAVVKAWMGMIEEQREVEELERLYNKVTPQ